MTTRNPWEKAGRERKAARLVAAIARKLRETGGLDALRHGRSVAMVLGQATDEQWAQVAELAGVPMPSRRTRDRVVELFEAAA